MSEEFKKDIFVVDVITGHYYVSHGKWMNHQPVEYMCWRNGFGIGCHTKSKAKAIAYLKARVLADLRMYLEGLMDKYKQTHQDIAKLELSL